MSVMPRKIPALVAFGLWVSVVAPVPAEAQTPPPSNAASTPDQAQQTPAGKFIQDLGNKAIGIIADKSLTQQQRSDKYEDLLRDDFDLPTIGRFVLGRAWNTATPEQQQEYMKVFGALVVKMYGDRLSFYSGESFHVKSVRAENDKDFAISSAIDHPGGAQPTPVDWRVRQNGDKLAIVDVSVEGVSQSITQRQEYASILERNNGNIDALLKLMRDRLQNPTPDGGQQQPASGGP